MSEPNDNDPIMDITLSPDISERVKKKLLTAGIPPMRDDRIYRAYLSGKSIPEIAAKHKLRHCTVTEIIDYVERFYNAKIVKDIQALREKHAQKYEHLYNEAMRAWQRSKRPKKTTRRGSSVGGKEGCSSHEEEIVQESVGDPRFLNSAKDALVRIGDLYGLDAPKKTAITNAAGDGDPKMAMAVFHKRVEDMTPEELQRIVDLGKHLETIEVEGHTKESPNE